MKKLIVFTGKNCHSCHDYIAKLKKHGIDFTEISVDTMIGAFKAAEYQVRSLPYTYVVGAKGDSMPGNLPIETVRMLLK